MLVREPQSGPPVVGHWGGGPQTQGDTRDSSHSEGVGRSEAPVSFISMRGREMGVERRPEESKRLSQFALDEKLSSLISSLTSIGRSGLGQYMAIIEQIRSPAVAPQVGFECANSPESRWKVAPREATEGSIVSIQSRRTGPSKSLFSETSVSLIGLGTGQVKIGAFEDSDRRLPNPNDGNGS